MLKDQKMRYTSTVTAVDQGALEKYFLWLTDNHGQLVMNGEALSAEISVVEKKEGPEGLFQLEATYLFKSREKARAFLKGAGLNYKSDSKVRWLNSKKLAIEL